MSRVYKATPQTTPSTPEKRQSRIAAPSSATRPTSTRTIGLPATPKPVSKDSSLKVERTTKVSIMKKPSFTSTNPIASASTAVNRQTATVGRPISTVVRPSTSSHTYKPSATSRESLISPSRTNHGLPSTPKATSRIKDAIAAKRAEARKAQLQTISYDDGVPEVTLNPNASRPKNQDIDVDLGRWSTRETIERARNSGSSML